MADEQQVEQKYADILLLYEQGNVEKAMNKLDELLDQKPEDRDLKLLKCRWLIEQKVNAEFVGAYLANELKGGPDAELQPLVAGAETWAESLLVKSRRALSTTAHRESRVLQHAAGILAPWCAPIHLGRALILRDILARQPWVSEGYSQPLDQHRGNELSQEMIRALNQAWSLAPHASSLRREVARLLVEILESTGDAALADWLAGMLAEETGEMDSLAMRVHTWSMRHRLNDVLEHLSQLLRCDDRASAGPLLEAALLRAPGCLDLWLLVGEWFLGAGMASAAGSVYRWLTGAPDGSIDGVSGDLADLAALQEQARRAAVACGRCGRVLSPPPASCPVCEQTLARSLLIDRFTLYGLPVAEVARVGLAEAHAALGEYAAASEALAAALAALPADHPAGKPVSARLQDLRAQAAEQAYQMQMAAAKSALKEGDAAAARAALERLDSEADGGDELRVWLALSYGAGELCAEEAAAAMQRAALVPGAVWAATPVAYRQRLVAALIAAALMPEARAALDRIFTAAERASSRVRRLEARCERLTAVRIADLLDRARTAWTMGDAQIAAGLVDSALALDSGSVDAVLLRGRLRLAAGQVYGAAADFQSVLARPDSHRDGAAGEALLGLARTHEALHDLSGAMAILQSLDQHLPEVRRLRGQLERRLQQRPAVLVTRVDRLVSSTTLRRIPLKEPACSASFAIAVRAGARWRSGSHPSLSLREVVTAAHTFVAALGSLAGAAGRPAFELRLIGRPDAETPSNGQVSVAILCRLLHRVAEGAEQLALEMWERLRMHLPAAEHYIYQYEPVYDEEELQTLLEPFPVRDAAEIVRRETWQGDAYAVQPYSTSMTGLEDLTWVLLRQSEPALISIRLEPTRLFPWEQAAFRENHDRLRRLPIPVPSGDESVTLAGDDPRISILIPDGRQHSLVEANSSMHHALEKQAYLMRVLVASAAGSAPLLPSAVAAELFGPGGHFVVIRAEDEQSREAIRRNLASLDAERWIPSGAPRRLVRLRYLVTEAEGGWTFRLPLPGPEGIPGLPAIMVKAVPPLKTPHEGLFMGESLATVAGVPVIIRAHQADRRRHLYIIGKTGAGKSTLIEVMALQDLEAGRGVAVLDPHGDAVRNILSRIPAHRADDVILLNPADDEWPVGVNYLQAETDNERHRIATEFIEMLMKMYDPHHLGIAGPLFQHTVRMGMLTAMMALPDATLVDVVRVLTDEDYGKSLLPAITDPLVRIYWEQEVPNTTQNRKGEVLSWVVSKFNKFTGDLRVRNIVGQSRTTLNFRKIMDERKILLVNLSKGALGDESAAFLGFLTLQSLLNAALSRVDQDRDERVDYCLYVDEFQTFATESFTKMLSEGRKYGLCLVMANQFIGQLPPSIREAVFGNVGSLAAFQVDAEDAHWLASRFDPVFSADDLINLPRYTAAVRLLVDGQNLRPFAMRTRLDRHLPDAAQAERIIAQSRRRYGRPVADVNREIGARFRRRGPG